MSEKKPWRIRVQGPVGKALEHFCTFVLADLDFDKLLDPYRSRQGHLCGTDVLLWGQSVSCALRCLPFLDNAEVLEEKLRKTLNSMMALQSENEAITAFPDRLQLQGLDIPARRLVLKALLLGASMPEPEKGLKTACIRMADQIMTLVGPGKRSILHCGTLGGLDGSALLDVMAQLYTVTGEQRFLEFARYIAECGGSQQHDIFKALKNAMAPSSLASGHAPGLTGCFRGLAELGKADAGSAEYCRELCHLYMERIAAEELFITGSGGGGESGLYWCQGAFHQTSPDAGTRYTGSSQVIVECLSFFHALSGFKDPWRVFHLAERSFYNALLGAWHKENCSWDLQGPAPLTDVRTNKVPEKNTLYELLKGGEALALFPAMAINTFERGAMLNFYEEMEAHLSRKTLIRVTGGYPGCNRADIRIRSRKPFAISLRIPENCTGVYYCSDRLAYEKNSYLTIDRPWEPDEVLTVEFDPAVRSVKAPDDSAFQAFMRGPLVLAADGRGKNLPECLTQVRHNLLELTDFASAGKNGSEQEHFTVWFRKMLPDYLMYHFNYD